jgi:hypothetical protein
MALKNGAEGGIVEGRIAKILKIKAILPFSHAGLLFPFAALCCSLPGINPLKLSR